MNLFDIFVTQPILNLLLTIYQIVGDFGVSIILFAVIVKMLVWPITKSNLAQSKKMRELQPEIAKIKRETKGNRTAEALRITQLYKENDIKQFRILVRTIIQISIFITLFSSLNIVVKRTEIPKFAYKPVAEFSRVKELTSDKEFNPKLFGVINLSEKALPINSKSSVFLLLMAIFSSWVQWYLMRQMSGGKNSRSLKEIMKDASNGKEADQAELNQIVSKNMSFLLPVMMFMMMAGLYGAITFYYAVSNLIQLVQQNHIMKSQKNENPKIKNAKEAKIVSGPKSSGGVRRIKAKDDRRKK